MKCAHVRSVIVEYAEHALCVADELCVDIHLIQCDACRAELANIAWLNETIHRGLGGDVLPPDTVGLLGRLDALPERASRRASISLRRLSGSMLRAAVIAAIVFFAATWSATMWKPNGAGLLGLLPAEAASDQPLSEGLRPWRVDGELKELVDAAFEAPRSDAEPN